MLFGPEGFSKEMQELALLLQALNIGDETNAKRIIKEQPQLLDKTDAEWLGNITPLLAAVTNPQHTCSLDLFKQILQNTQNLNAQCVNGKAAIHHIAATNNVEHLLALLAFGPKSVDINLKDFLGLTAVHIAALNNQAQALNYLIQYKADVNIPTPDGRTPLQSACLKGNLVCVQLLLAAGAKVNQKDSKQRTAVHYLAQSKCLDEQVKSNILSCLIEHGLDVNEKSISGKIAFEMAEHFQSGQNFVNSLLEQNVPSLRFLCTKAIVQHDDNLINEEQMAYLPEDLINSIEAFKRCK